MSNDISQKDRDPYRDHRKETDGSPLGNKVAVWTTLITVVGGVITAVVYGAFGYLNGGDASNSTLIRSGRDISAGRDININSPDPNAKRSADTQEAVLAYARERDARDRAEKQKAESAQLNSFRQQIQKAGFTLDAEGLARSLAQGTAHINAFNALGIQTNEGVVRSLFPKISQSQRLSLAASLNALGYPFGYSLQEEVMDYFRASLKQANQPETPKLKAKLCDPKQYKYPPNAVKLAEACRAPSFGLAYIQFVAEGL